MNNMQFNNISDWTRKILPDLQKMLNDITSKKLGPNWNNYNSVVLEIKFIRRAVIRFGSAGDPRKRNKLKSQINNHLKILSEKIVWLRLNQ